MRNQWTKEIGWKNLSDVSFVIIGCGGIGSNIVEILSRKRNLSLALIDHDTVEISNLNRSSFLIKDIYSHKVDALKRKIDNSNTDQCDIVTISEKLNKSTIEPICKLLRETICFEKICVFDCRDKDFKDHDMIKSHLPESCIIRAAYNGHSLTLTSNWMEYPIWGRNGYTTSDSSAITSKLVAVLALIFADLTISDPNRYNEIYTFDTYNDIIPLLFDNIKNKGEKI
ncbi:MAG: ThiF family adenylyltransferase [bacterium]